MTREETSKILSYLKAAYPASFKDMAKNDMVMMLSLWERKFKEIPADLVFLAVDALIDYFKFPPSVSDVENQLEEIYWDNFMDLWAYNSGTLLLSDEKKERVQYIDRQLCGIVDGGRKYSELVSTSNKKMIGDGK
jgi:hypothetical protein